MTVGERSSAEPSIKQNQERRGTATTSAGVAWQPVCERVIGRHVTPVPARRTVATGRGNLGMVSCTTTLRTALTPRSSRTGVSFTRSASSFISTKTRQAEAIQRTTFSSVATAVGGIIISDSCSYAIIEV